MSIEKILVDGSSMENSLHDGEQVLIEKATKNSCFLSDAVI